MESPSTESALTFQSGSTTPSTETASTSASARTSTEMSRPEAFSEIIATTTKPKGNPLPPLARHYPKPEDELDIDAMLARKPGKWTFQGSLAARRPVATLDEEKLREQRAKELEHAKKELAAASEQMKLRLPVRRDS